MKTQAGTASTTGGLRRIPGLWVCTLYFAEGFPYTIVNLMSVILLKDLGASNELIGLSSFLYLPWAVKGFWGPLVELTGTKRRWIVSMQLLCACLCCLLAASVLSTHVFVAVLVAFTMIAFVSATHDIAIDGYYLDTLLPEQQAFFVGWRTTAYKVAWLVGNGALVYLAATIAGHVRATGAFVPGNVEATRAATGPWAITAQGVGWATTFLVCALMFGLLYAFHVWYLPSGVAPGEPTNRPPIRPALSVAAFGQAFGSYFSQPRIGWIILYVLIFRLGDAFMLKMAAPFLMDPADKGGLGIATGQMGILYGTVGVSFLLAGGILGGYLIARDGLLRWMWPTAVLQNLSIVLYWLLALHRPSLAWVYVINSFEQFAYGLGVSAYTVFLMRTVRPEFKAAHYAITTTFMAAGVMVPGLASGYLQKYLGYEHFFLMSFLVAIPGLLTIAFLPLGRKARSISATT